MDCNVFAKGEIQWNAPIFQYMRLDYLISILSTKEYYVRPRCEFHDAFEMNLPLSRMFPLYEAERDVHGAIKGEIEIMAEKMKANRENGKLLTSCWCSQPNENILMWNCYASKVGVRVKSTISRFMSSLKTDEYFILCDYMNYAGYSFQNEDFLFTKDKGFESEREFRFYFIPKVSNPDSNASNAKPVRINVEPLELIESITVSPCIEIRSANEICKLIKDRYGVRIHPSALKING